MRRLRWPVQVVELLACNREAAINALKNTNLVNSLNEILATYGLDKSASVVETTPLIKLSARILATVMNHGEAKFQFIDEGTQNLMNLIFLMSEQQVFDTST